MKQVLVTTRVKVKEDSENYESGWAASPDYQTRLVYVEPQRFEIPDQKENIEPLLKAYKQGHEGLDMPVPEQLKHYDRLAKEWQEKNQDLINEWIAKKESEMIESSVRKYYGERFISVEIHETIAMSESLTVTR